MFIFLVIALTIYNGWQMIFGYMHPYPYCNIKIKKHLLRGDKQSIKEAMKMLRRNDVESYKTVCRFVDVIEEKRCYNADVHIDKAAFNKIHEGCFIHGTHIIYLEPNNYSEQSVLLRTEVIKALAEKSRDFWMNEAQK